MMQSDQERDGPQGDGTMARQYGFQQLLVTGNPKVAKGQKYGYFTAILHLAPANLSGYEVCRGRSAGCTAACLNTAGRGGIFKAGQQTNSIQEARIARTKLFFERPAAFATLLEREIRAHIARCERLGMRPAVRLNGTSDLAWEGLPLIGGKTVFEAFPDVQFYDYTKISGRALRYAQGRMPGNYHVTFSRSESNWAQCERVLAAGGNVAAVFARSSGLPSEYAGYPVINGDETDLRFTDPRGCIVGLLAKGRGRGDESGFVVSLN